MWLARLLVTVVAARARGGEDESENETMKNLPRRLTANSLLTCDFDSSTCGFDYTTDYDWTHDAYGGWLNAYA